jgi:hypothetical protein
MKPVAFAAVFLGLFGLSVVAQPPQPPPAQNYPPPQGGPPQQPGYPPQGYPPPQAPQDLERLVDRIALYPDPLLGNILAASTYSDQIFDAEAWAHRHGYLHGPELARAISDDHLWFDPSVQALLPFPDVLDMMARDIGWTRALGDAFLANRAGLMDAVQRLRHRAWDYGYLRSTPQIMVNNGPYIDIVPVDPAFYFVPYYDPTIVFFPPRPGFRVGLGIRFGPGIALGAAFAPWGWFGGGVRFGWGAHAFFLNNRVWEGVRPGYVHPSSLPRYPRGGFDRREMHERREGGRERR